MDDARDLRNGWRLTLHVEVRILGSYTQHIAHANVENHFGQRALVRRHERGTDRVDGRRQDARVWGRARGHVANLELSDRAGVSRGARTLPTVVDTHDVAERVKTLARKLGVDLERRLGSVQVKIAARDGAGGGGVVGGRGCAAPTASAGALTGDGKTARARGVTAGPQVTAKGVARTDDADAGMARACASTSSDASIAARTAAATSAVT